VWPHSLASHPQRRTESAVKPAQSKFAALNQ
jgi:hypothetical protein